MQCTAKGGALCQQSTKKTSLYLTGLTGRSVTYKCHHSSSFLNSCGLFLVIFSNTYKIAALLQNSSKDFWFWGCGEDLVFSIWKLLQVLQKSSHQDCGPCYLHLGEGNSIFCCTGPTDPNFWQIKITIIRISHANFYFFRI